MDSVRKPANRIRQDFIEFFEKRGHTFVPSSSLVPGGDQTLLFTNAGMVQFKDVFLGLDKRPYVRAANSQKCMRVAGKHNDLDDVGRDDTHHTFFEMLGNWSFGDYYKKEAIAWAWELLTEVWRLPKESIWATCFRDEYGEIPEDSEAAEEWHKQPGIDPSHILFFGREENFWEMAETGPNGPCSEIHIDRGLKYCNRQDTPGHTCEVNGNCQRFLELWNLVFIQYNRLGPDHLEPLPAKHVDTGMGFERIVSVLQDVDSNYKTDLFTPLMDAIQELTGNDNNQRAENITPYRVIADHARAATFLIADGVIPGNIGRNYICRMIIRRASRFGAEIGLDEPFMSKIAEKVVAHFGNFFPELVRNRVAIIDSLIREEQQFQRTVESGVAKLENQLDALAAINDRLLPGEQAFDLYATYGLPFEIIQDIAREREMDVEESGFRRAMENHRLVSGASETFGELGGEDVELYRELFARLQSEGALDQEGVIYNPYNDLKSEATVLALIRDGMIISQAEPGDRVEILLPSTTFYIEAGGQVSDTGWITSTKEPGWEIRVTDVRRPSAGMIVHIGEVVDGQPKIGDLVVSQVNAQRRNDIKRNHTATHLLHAALQAVLGDHARQAGSLVAPDRLRFDFNHPAPVTNEQLGRIEAGVNAAILGNYHLHIQFKPLQQAINEGATALFGEKYDDTVRNITIDDPEAFSNELCGGTHVEETGDIGLFLITSEGSAAAGIRRIEAITGRFSYDLAEKRMSALKQSASLLAAVPEEVPSRINELITENTQLRRQMNEIRRTQASLKFVSHLERTPTIHDIPVLNIILEDTDADTLRFLGDRFRERNSSGVAVLASVDDLGKPIIIAIVTEDLVQRGLHAGELAKFVAKQLGGGGGGRPTLAQAGGKDASRLEEAMASVPAWVEINLS